MSVMKVANGRGGKAQFPTTYKGLAMILVVMVVVTPLAVAVSNQTRLQARDLQEKAQTPGPKQLGVAGAPQLSPTIQWTYTVAGTTVWAPPIIADLRGDGQLEVVFGAFDSKTYCLDARTGKLLWSYETGGQIWYSPAVADLFANGKKEVIVGSFDSIVYCLDGTTGSVLWSYKTGAGPGNPVLSTPVVADLFGDGKQEVIATSGRVYCLEGTTGRMLWSCTTAGWVESSPIAVDVLGDGKKEVIVSSDDHHVYCLNGTTGQKVWSCATGDMISLHPTVVDLNADGTMEVIAGSYDNKTYCLDGKTGSLLWNYTTQSTIQSPPLSADLFGDGKKEIVLVAPDPLPPISPTNKVYCLNGTTGQALWIYHTGYIVFSAPVAANLLANGREQLVVVSDTVACLDGAGVTKWSHTPSSSLGSTPLVVNLYGDGRQEVIIGDDGVYCLGGQNGSVIWSLPKGESVQIIPVAADFDGDGVQELVAVSFGIGFTNVYCMSYTSHLPPYPPPPGGPVTAEVFSIIIGSSVVLCLLALLVIGKAIRNNSRTMASQRPSMSLGECAICKLDLSKGDEIVRCPYCGSMAHKTHMLEWLHVKSYCPSCRQHLNEEDLKMGPVSRG